jgi:hypothetical protein
MNHADFTSGCDHVSLWSDTLSAAAVESAQIRTLVGYDPLSDGRRFAGATCFQPPAQINDGLMMFINSFNVLYSYCGHPSDPSLRFQLTSWHYSVLSKD